MSRVYRIDLNNQAISGSTSYVEAVTEQQAKQMTLTDWEHWLRYLHAHCLKNGMKPDEKGLLYFKPSTIFPRDLVSRLKEFGFREYFPKVGPLGSRITIEELPA